MIKDSGRRREFYKADGTPAAVRDIQEEQWLPIVGYEGLYEISNIGRVRSLYKKTRIADKEQQMMRQKYDQRGYFRVNLHKDRKCKAELVSRLVAKAFIPNPDNLPQVGHWDDNKENNVLENLYWTDAKENNYHNGKLERFQEERMKKIDTIARKLSVKVVATDVVSGEKLIFQSIQEAKRNGFDSAKVSMCINGKRKSHKGYKWERA